MEPRGEAEIEKHKIAPSVEAEVIPSSKNTTIDLLTKIDSDTKLSDEQMILRAKSFLASLASTSQEVSTSRVFAQKVEDSWRFFALSKAGHLLTLGEHGLSRNKDIPPWVLQAGVISDNQITQSRSYRLDIPSDQEIDVKTVVAQLEKGKGYIDSIGLQRLEGVLLAELIKKSIGTDDVTIDPDRTNRYTYQEREKIIGAFVVTCQKYPETMRGIGLEIKPFEEHGSTKKMEEVKFFASLKSLGLLKKTGKIQKLLGRPEINLNYGLRLRRNPIRNLNSWALFLPSWYNFHLTKT